MLPRVLAGVVLCFSLPAPVTAEEPAAIQVKGYLVPTERAAVSARVGGFVREVLVRDGDIVRQGQVLAKLDDAEAVADLKIAEAKVNLGLAKVVSARHEREAAINAAKRERVAAERLLAAIRDSGTAKEKAAAEDELRKADGRLELLEVGGKAFAVLEAEVMLAKAELERAKVQLDATVVRAPINATVVSRKIDIGQLVKIDGGALFDLVDFTSLRVTVTVPVKNLGWVAKGQLCTVVVTGQEVKLTAKVAQLAPTVDPATDTVEVSVALDPTKAPLRPGTAVVVSFLKAEK